MAVAMQNGDIETAEETMQRVVLGLESVDIFEESEQLQSLRDGTLALGAQLDDVTVSVAPHLACMLMSLSTASE